VYQKSIRAWIVIVAVGLFIGLGGLYVSNWLLVPFVAWAILGPRILLKDIACPKCGTPVTYQGTYFGARINGGFVRRQCQECSWDLRTTSDLPEANGVSRNDR
jgi:hypothetical protein